MLKHPLAEIGEVLAELAEMKAELQHKIDEEHLASAKHNNSVNWEDISPTVLDFNNIEERLKVREMCKFTFKQITIRRYKKTFFKAPQKKEIYMRITNPPIKIPARNSKAVPCLTWGNRKSNRYIYHLDIEFIDGEKRTVITNGNYHYTDVKLLNKDAMKSLANGLDTKLTYVDFFEHIQFD